MRSDIQKRIEQVLHNLPREECRTCDCFLGLITRLTLDAKEDVPALIKPFKELKTKIHGCLGCDPCPPAEAYAHYIRENPAAKARH